MRSLFDKASEFNRTPILNKVAAIISMVVGLSAVAIGGQVLLGKVPEHFVVPWMPPLQFMIGLVSATFIAFLMWKDNMLAMIMAVSTLVLHALVLVILVAAYSDVVASNTINMTAIRIGTWIVINLLMIIHQRQKKKLRHA